MTLHIGQDSYEELWVEHESEYALKIKKKPTTNLKSCLMQMLRKCCDITAT